MTRVKINVTSNHAHEEIVINVPEWDELTPEDQQQI